MIKEFCVFYTVLEELSYIDFCKALEYKKVDLEAKVDWMKFHGNIGYFLAKNQPKAEKLYNYILDKALNDLMMHKSKFCGVEQD
jgi:hypothetical protein